MTHPDPPDAPAVGDVVRNERLGTLATYRIRSCSGELVEVEVVDALGLEPGARFRFTAEAVSAMQCVSAG
jgi:hypothetical protein